MKCSRLTDESINRVSDAIVGGNNILHRACVHNSQIVPFLLENERLTEQSVNAKNVYGGTALHWACEYQPDAVEYLLNCDKFTTENINAIKHSTGRSALHHAYINPNVKALEYLLSSNKLTISTVGAFDADGYTACDLARKTNQKKLLNV